ncbi:hypothetical protein EAI30_14105 [Romboutsia ilealis]|uniref:Uncharacterized protein n=1 Tax=Romboutsia faecis TaxID=2764597 RepID=A0ABR7JTF9_9FIRM|nr:hypothetical protein [Romboutsia faecis]MBC5998063.1 hypothetical protein [Romboutsia faecis]MRN25754.1 hypothetical protein [Romboutsia ilealis]
MNIKFNIKGVILGVVLVFFIIGGFLFLPKMFIEDSTPVDYTMIQRDAIPEKILNIMDKYTNEERALAVKLDNKIYVIVTRSQEKDKGIEIDKISIVKEEDKNTMKVEITYKDKEDSYPFVVAETNLTELPDKIELDSSDDAK